MNENEHALRDITENKRVEEALKQSEKKFLKIFQGSPVAITLSRVRDGRFIEVNDTFERLTGYRRQEVIGRTASDIGLWVDTSQGEELTKRLLSERSLRDLELRFRMKNNSVLTCSVSAELIEVGKEPCILSVASDVTQRKLAEDALRKSEERLRLAAQAGKVYAYEWDAATDVITRSGDISGVLGSTGEALLTRPQLLTRVHPDDRARFAASITERTPENPDIQISYRLLCPDGSIVWLEKTAHAFFDEDGRIIRMIGMVADISQRKRAEAAIRESEMRYRRIVETTNEGVWLLDSNLCNSFVNQQLAEMLGYEPGEMVGRSVFDFYFPEDVERKKQVLSRRRQGVREQLEERLRRKDGSELWVRMAGTPLFREDGEFDGALAMLCEITELKRAEKTLRQSEEWLRLAIQAGKMYAYEWDVATDVLVRSPEYVNVLGATEPRTSTHQQAMEKIHPDDRPKLVAAVARHSPKNPTVDVTYRVLLPGQAPVWVKSSGRAFFDGEGRMSRVVGIVADITDQKLAEEALRDSEERLSLAQKVAGIGTFERNVRTGVNTWTAEMESMYGLPPGGFGQTRAAFENLIHPDDRPRVIKLLERALKTGRPTDGEWRVVWPDGSVHWIAGRWQLLTDESGEPSRVVGVNIDVTERKQAEEVLSDMTRKLVEAQEQERVRIARELHDDINQHLALLAIELDQLREKHNDWPSEVRGHMHELQQMTGDISSRVYALSHELYSSIPDSLGLAKGMRSWCRQFGERRKMDIDFKCHDLPRLSQEISLCLFRVLQEALHNAATHSGAKRIEVQLAENSGEIHLIVSDSGKGFDVEAAKQNRGLGLTSMQERVRLAGGTIVIDSKPLAGTTVHVRVPFKAERNYQHQITPD